MTHVDPAEHSLTTLAQARYRSDYPLANEQLNDTVALMMRHRSVRKYTAEPVSDHDVDLIVTAAQSASSSSNTQTWTVIAIRDKARLKNISELIGGRDYVENCAVFLAWVADLNRAENLLADAGVTPEDLGYLENTLVAFTDIGIASQNALLAAESLGLGGVYVGSLRNNPPAITTALDIPMNAFPALGMAIGHPDPAEGAGIKPRLPLATVLHHEKYDPEAWREGVSTFERTYGEYFAEQGKQNASWIKTMVDRMGTIAGLRGRDTMRDKLAQQGFESK